MPFSRASSSADNLCAAAILAIVSPFRARTVVRPEFAFASAVFGVARRQFVKRTLLFGTTSLFVDLRSTPGFIACNVVTLTAVRLATECKSSPQTNELTHA